MQIITASVKRKQAPARYYDSIKTNHIADHARPTSNVNLQDLCNKKSCQTFGLPLTLPLLDP